MRVVSLNVGLPQQFTWQGAEVFTGIFKRPVETPLTLRRLNFDGDGQADLTVHGGEAKAVYSYPSEYYGPWSERLSRTIETGMFGENLTTEGLFEDDVNIGDEFRVGTAVLVARQPRLPCYKLGLRFDDESIIKKFVQSGRPGIYFTVKTEGVVGPGDSIERLHTDAHGLTITRLFQMITDKKTSHDDLRRALDVPALTDNWRESFTERLAR